ncbi:DUF488 domain-containing protein [Arthrobacter sp. YN]|uniref:DUF488 domain-containing protein n=1 Tax=Arthrobacter sp. YN TaxID=2020486 RepID=UPI000B61568C|nr:DUF488 domain-containing protein [Arthrobacter sp. YN]ASN20127.1 hypothetical protein CGK93_10945 [Arthrobacter sp. YN]
MWTETSGVIGVGYEGKDLAPFLEELAAWKIGTVVDVRLNSISRKKGFSKKALTEALARAGIDYRHMPALGNPKDNREGFWAPGTAAAKTAEERYESLLDGETAAAKIRELADIAVEQRVAVLCFEASELCCHRKHVLARVKVHLATLVHG